MKNNNNFDFLRFLFSFLVVIGHSILLSGNPEFWNGFFAAMPNFSVYSFFIISGFLISAGNKSARNTRVIYCRKFEGISRDFLSAVFLPQNIGVGFLSAKQISIIQRKF